MTGPFGAPEPYTCPLCDGPSEQESCCRWCWYGGAVLAKLWAGVMPEGFAPAHTGGGCFVIEACPRPGNTIYIVNLEYWEHEGRSGWEGGPLSGDEPPADRMVVTAYVHDDETGDGWDEPIYESQCDKSNLPVAVSNALIALQGR